MKKLRRNILPQSSSKEAKKGKDFFIKKVKKRKVKHVGEVVVGSYQTLEPLERIESLPSGAQSPAEEQLIRARKSAAILSSQHRSS
jgi:hypothetical protein